MPVSSDVMSNLNRSIVSNLLEVDIRLLIRFDKLKDKTLGLHKKRFATETSKTLSKESLSRSITRVEINFVSIFNMHVKSFAYKTVN